MAITKTKLALRCNNGSSFKIHLIVIHSKIIVKQLSKEEQIKLDDLQNKIDLFFYNLQVVFIRLRSKG